MQHYQWLNLPGVSCSINYNSFKLRPFISMDQLLQYLGLCFFRNNPLDLTPAKSFMWKTIAFYLISGMIVEFLIADVEGILEVCLRIFMAFASIATLLFYLKKFNNFNQLFTAVFICENFIMTLATATEAVYFYMVMKRVHNAEEISIAVGVFLVFWYIALVSYILRKMFDFKIVASVILAFSYFVLTYGIPMLLMDM